MNKRNLPREIVDRQLRAYNAHDIEEFCSLYAQDAIICKLNRDQARIRGIDAIRAAYGERFKNPALHGEIKSRIEVGNFVIDHERVVGLADDPLEAIAIYEVQDSLIRSVRFIVA
jgi:hypothetical protein